MDSSSYIPMRAVVRCKAKQKLLQIQSDLDSPGPFEALDEALFQELAATLFQSEKYHLHRDCQSKREASAVEDQLAVELANTYSTIVQQQQNALVRQLNALL
ncbi:hypothetical protein H6F43_06615 [Leptolyngbya sp. FACHB-36]|uniref:hypothetical protein n=1 Tax=Leptolyngbya sp. FACHB-36 TaxID=2692808 RepID=UPI001681ACCF|nr:hypothetical protein [Leptolyngbya sp. FACHB-36]MBD2019860.1 hypothetical protein [Leptolyngbya sp. FACHB-36]